MKSIRLLVPMAICAFGTSPAFAHTMWLNFVAEPVEQHIITSISYGDFMPGSDLLVTDWGNMTVSTYELVAPDGSRSGLGVPQLGTQRKEKLSVGATLQLGGDTGVRKIAFPSEAPKGTYQVNAQSQLLQYITYRNNRGEEVTSDQPYAALKDVKTVVSVVRDAFFMKAIHAVGGWTEAKTLGHPLEIVPITDLASLKVGDRVRFKVLLNGSAWQGSGGSARIGAYNAGFGSYFGIDSVLKYGEASFTVPVAGLWRLDARVQGKSGDFPKVVAGASAVPGTKSDDVPLYISSTLVFNVAP